MYNIYTSVVKVIKDSRFRVTVFFQDFVIFEAVFFDSMQVSTPPPPPLPPTLFQRVSVQSRKVMIAPLLTLCVAFRVTRGAFFDHARAQLEASSDPRERGLIKLNCLKYGARDTRRKI